jgi:hypothetical protein
MSSPRGANDSVPLTILIAMRVSSLANSLVRSNYLAVAICAPLLAALPAAFSLSALFEPSSNWSTIFMVALLAGGLYVLPGIRAIRRVFRNGTVIPPRLVGERPVVTFVVTVFGVIGHLFFVITTSAAIAIALAPEWPEEAKKIVGFLAVGLMAYLIALACGELALVGDGESDQPRAPKSADH